MVYLMQYVRGTLSCGIIFSGSMFDTHMFTDADWAGDVLTMLCLLQVVHWPGSQNSRPQ